MTVESTSTKQYLTTTDERALMRANKLQAENEELRRRLEEAEETIHAIRSGAVDAFVVEEQAATGFTRWKARTAPIGCSSSKCSRARRRCRPTARSSTAIWRFAEC